MSKVKVTVPDEIPVGGFKFKIFLAAGLVKRGLGQAIVRSYAHEILFDPLIPEYIRDRNFFHELIHVIENEFFGKELGEDKCHTIATALHQVFSTMFEFDWSQVKQKEYNRNEDKKYTDLGL